MKNRSNFAIFGLKLSSVAPLQLETWNFLQMTAIGIQKNAGKKFWNFSQNFALSRLNWSKLQKSQKRVPWICFERHGTSHAARSNYQDPKSSIGIEKCWKLTKWRPIKCRFLTFFGKMVKMRHLYILWTSRHCTCS